VIGTPWVEVCVPGEVTVTVVAVIVHENVTEPLAPVESVAFTVTL